jgi:hypothetical protein
MEMPYFLPPCKIFYTVIISQTGHIQIFQVVSHTVFTPGKNEANVSPNIVLTLEQSERKKGKNKLVNYLLETNT